MAKDPAFLFYYQDFLVGIDDMTNEEAGAYIRCLCIQAAKGGVSEDHMKNICKSHEIHMKLRKKFFLDEQSGLLKNIRLEKEVGKRKNFVNSRAINRLGKKKEITYENHMKNTSKSYEKHMENENSNVFVLDNKGAEKEIWNTKPTTKDLNGLPENFKQLANEAIFTQTRSLTSDKEINRLWELFKGENLIGQEYYQRKENVYQHFIRALKKQKFKQPEKQKQQEFLTGAPLTKE